MGSQDRVEREIKLRVANAEKILAKLEALGFRVAKERVYETNAIYDTPERLLKSSGQLLRLRDAGGNAVLTYKGPATPCKHKSREELETTVGDSLTAALIFNRLGFEKTFKYEKFRTEFCRLGMSGVVTLDETPIGWFLELEGDGDWIDQTASELGFTESDYEISSYGTLYVRYCTERGETPRDMLFR